MTTLLNVEAYNGIVQMINEGKIKYGTIYSLNKIASELNMSRTPVRDAVLRLCDENRLELLPSRGFRLHRMTEEEMREAYHFSNAVEGYCVYQLANACKAGEKQEWLSKLQANVENMTREDLQTLDFADFFLMDNDFHLLLIASLEDENILNLSEHRYGFYNRTELHLIDRPLSRAQILDFHRRILEAVEKGEAENAYGILLEYAHAIYHRYLQEQSAEKQ